MDLIGFFTGDIGIMISALLIFAGIADMMVLVLFFSRQSPSRASDANMTEQQKKLVLLRRRRYQITQFCIAMSGLFMIAAGLYGISTHLVN